MATLQHKLIISNLTFDEIREFTPRIHGWLNPAINILTLVLCYGCFIVHRAVYRTLKRLGPRYINTIIIPSMVRTKYSRKSKLDLREKVLNNAELYHYWLE